MDKKASTEVKVKKKAPVKIKKTAVETEPKSLENAETVDQVKPKIEFKQVVVGIIILLVAAMLLLLSLGDLKKTGLWSMLFENKKSALFEPKNVYVAFNATTEKEVDFDIYYTVQRETWFTEDNVFHLKGKKGTHFYIVSLPVDKIYSLRIDFGVRPGKMTMHDVRLMGTQKADLGDFRRYRYNQINDVVIDENGDLSFSSDRRDPYIYLFSLYW